MHISVFLYLVLSHSDAKQWREQARPNMASLDDDQSIKLGLDLLWLQVSVGAADWKASSAAFAKGGG